ncbi:hypothetical protein MHYP_G00308410 [Metynnis hypsauchen]
MDFKQTGLGVLLLVLLSSCNAQLPKWKRPHQAQQAGVRLPVQDPVSGVLVNPEDPLSVQLKQVVQGQLKKLIWHFPQAPEKPQQPVVHFEPRQPVSTVSVAADCGQSSVYVEVKKDLFGTGELIDPSALSLGGCAVTGEDSAAQVLIFEAELQLCNSVLRTTAHELVYSFILHYAPERLGGKPITRTSGATVGIECHYPRLHNVSSNALLPAWIPYASTVTAEERLVFSLRLMTDDWQYERPSNQYFLGDLINIEASVMQYNHMYLTCFLKATLASAPTDAMYKACSFTANRWTSVDLNDQVCGCCDTSCSFRAEGLASPVAGPRWEGNLSVGPVRIGEKSPVWRRGG